MLTVEGLLDLRAVARARRPWLAAPGPLAPAVVATWCGRMINEYMSSFVFAGLAAQMEAAGDADAAAQCRAFADEEREHGALCGAVVEAAGGEARQPVAPPRAIPAHAATTRRVAAARNLIFVSCMSETVAVALIGAERLEMEQRLEVEGGAPGREGELLALLTRIWADEIGHARFGWAWLDRTLPACTDEERAAIERYLPTAFSALEAHELAHLPETSCPPEGGKTFGLCSGADARSLFYDTVTEVVVPELERRGFAARRAWDARAARALSTTKGAS